MLHLKIGVGACAAALAAHTAYTYRTRAAAPTGRLLQFSPGSEDQRLADTLKTGDLLVFRRDCSNHALFAAATCIARHAVNDFDHAGVIVLVRGVPHVAECTFSGVKVRPYDHRLRTSLSKEVLLRPLAFKLSPAQSSALVKFVEQRAATDGSRPVAIADLLRMPLNPRHNSAVDFVMDAYAAAGIAPSPPTAAAGASAAAGDGARTSPYGIEGLLHPAQPVASPQKLMRPVPVRAI